MGRRIQDIEQRLARHVNVAAAGEFRASEEIRVQTGPLWAKGTTPCFVSVSRV